MVRKLGSRFTYANVTSTVALVIAVTGGGVAVAASLPNNSVGSKQIINGSIKTKDLHAKSVTSAKIKNGTIAAADLNTGPLGVIRGYAWINDGSTTLDTDTPLSNGYTFNNSGGAISVNRYDTGQYVVTFAGLDIGYGHVQAGSYGSAATFCKVNGWGNNTAYVDCYDLAGAATDSSFVVSMAE